MDNESFFKMPKVLFTDEYKDLSAEAKLLYGLMLDRMQLSAINGWCDKNGEVFIFYTIAETSEMLGCGHDKATRLQRVCVRQNLVFRAIFESVSDDKYFLLPCVNKKKTTTRFIG